MTINYFIYDEVIDSFIEFKKGEEYLLQYYLISHYYKDLNKLSNLDIIRNKKRKLNNINFNTNKKFKYI